jgi:hypothetical protein
MSIRCPDNHGSSSNASGTRVVLPAPGGACNTAVGPLASARRNAGSDSSIGSEVLLAALGLMHESYRALSHRPATVQLTDRPKALRSNPRLPMHIFLPSDISTDCDRCGGRVDLLKGGVCTRCRRILCYTHLHGSWWRRLIADLRNESICIECRTHVRTRSDQTSGAPVDGPAR